MLNCAYILYMWYVIIVSTHNYIIPCILLDKKKNKVIDIVCFTAKQFIYISSRHIGIFTDFLL